MSVDPGQMGDLANSMGYGMNSEDATRALIHQLGASSADPEKLQALKRQQLMAQYMREGPAMPQGQYIPGYHGIGHYVAPNALQTLASGVQYGIGAKESMDALNQEKEMAAGEARNRTAVMNMILEQARRSQAGGQDPSLSVAPPDLSGYAQTPNIDNPQAVARNTNFTRPPPTTQKPLSWDDYLALQQNP